MVETTIINKIMDIKHTDFYIDGVRQPNTDDDNLQDYLSKLYICTWGDLTQKDSYRLIRSILVQCTFYNYLQYGTESIVDLLKAYEAFLYSDTYYLKEYIANTVKDMCEFKPILTKNDEKCQIIRKDILRFRRTDFPFTESVFEYYSNIILIQKVHKRLKNQQMDLYNKSYRKCIIKKIEKVLKTRDSAHKNEFIDVALACIIYNLTIGTNYITTKECISDLILLENDWCGLTAGDSIATYVYHTILDIKNKINVDPVFKEFLHQIQIYSTPIPEDIKNRKKINP